MKPEQFQRVRRLFEECQALPEAERVGFLDEACAEEPELRRHVDTMLAAATPEGFLEPLSELAGDEPSPAANVVPRQIGTYRIERVLGAGGMGVVYEATQANPRRRVALKMMRFGEGDARQRRRFEYEAEILGQLNHPGIAQIYEAGIFRDAEGEDCPFFAMEYVSGGRDILSYARDQELDRPTRLRLFVEVCEAIQQGHRQGIIHRDIKAGNVLVDETGRPKVIDFGVARAIDPLGGDLPSLTRAGDLVGSLHTMAPEQLEGSEARGDTRTDVYALGFLLYELIFEGRPHDFAGKSITEVARLIREAPPLDPRRTDHSVPPDLAWITLRALAKEPERRYSSVAELSADVQRYLSDQPVLAGPPSASYRLRKFARRHRLGVGAGAIVLVSLLGGGIATITALVRANVENEKFRSINVILTELLEGARAELGGGYDVPASRLVDRVADRLDSRPPARPSVEAPIRSTIARTYLSLGLPAKAEHHARRALELYEANASRHDPERLKSVYHLGVSLLRLDRLDEVDELLSRYRSPPGELGDDRSDDPGSATLLLLDAMWLRATGDLTAAETSYRRALLAYSRYFGPEHLETLLVAEGLSGLLVLRGQIEEPERLARRNVEVLERTAGTDSASTVHAREHLVKVLSQIERHRPEAITLLERTIPELVRIHGERHPRVALAKALLGHLYKVHEQPDEALPLLERSLELHGDIFGPKHTNTLVVLQSLGETYLLLDHPQAETFLRRALDARTEVLGPTHPDTLHSRLLLGRLYRRKGLWSKAEPILTELHERALGRFGEASLDSIEASAELAMLYDAMDDPRAAAHFEATLDRARRHLDPGHALTARLTGNLVTVLMKAGRAAEALPVAQEALTLLKRSTAKTDPALYAFYGNVVQLHFLLDQPEAAAALAREASELAQRSLPDRHRSRLRALFQYGECLYRTGRPAEASRCFAEILELGGLDVAFSPSERIRFRLIHGLCLKQSGRPREALEQYELGLQIEADDVNRPALAREADRLRSELEASPDDG